MSRVKGGSGERLRLRQEECNGSALQIDIEWRAFILDGCGSEDSAAAQGHKAVLDTHVLD